MLFLFCTKWKPGLREMPLLLPPPVLPLAGTKLIDNFTKLIEDALVVTDVVQARAAPAVAAAIVTSEPRQQRHQRRWQKRRRRRQQQREQPRVLRSFLIESRVEKQRPAERVECFNSIKNQFFSFLSNCTCSPKSEKSRSCTKVKWLSHRDRSVCLSVYSLG